MLTLWLKRKSKVWFARGSNAKRQNNPLTLIECLERNEQQRRTKKQLVFYCCVLFTIMYIFWFKMIYTQDDDHLHHHHIDFNETDSIEEKDNEIHETLHSDAFIVEAFTVGSDDILYKSLLSADPVTKPKPFVLRDSLPKCFTTIVGNVSVKVQKTVDDTVQLDELYPMVERGGHYNPRDCQARHKVAILVPFRNSEAQLRVFLYNIHPFLMRQKIEYRIIVIEQSGQDLINKGRLYNAGFHEMQIMGNYQCIVFHDVDLLPTDHRIQYSCPLLPRHMSASIIEEEKLNVSTSNRTKFSGVAAMTVWQFKEVNGYSNAYWGGIGEDEDMLKRLQTTGLGVTTYRKTIARYTSLQLPKTYESYLKIMQRKNNILLQTAADRYKIDGLSNLHYKKISYASHQLYTKILVDIDPPKTVIPITTNFNTIDKSTEIKLWNNAPSL